MAEYYEAAESGVTSFTVVDGGGGNGGGTSKVLYVGIAATAVMAVGLGIAWYLSRRK